MLVLRLNYANRKEINNAMKLTGHNVREEICQVLADLEEKKKGDRVILTNCHMITGNHKSFDPRVAALYSLSLRPQNVSVLNTRPQSFDLIDRWNRKFP